MWYQRGYHLLCFVLPLTSFLFLISQPHNIIESLAWTLPFWLILLIDWLNIDFGQPANPPGISVNFFDAILYALVLLQFANIYFMLQYVSELRWASSHEIFTNLVNLVVIRFLVGTSSGTSGIVVAHELIHRPQWHWQILGRLLLCTVCYEHFAITHKRSHHLNIGLTDDITAAKLGESFKDYWQRIRFGYLAYAWNSERERLVLASKPYQTLTNEVILGLLAEFTLLILIMVYFGWLAAFIFIYQAFVAARILEAVNYFQHWGLENGQFGNSYGWVTPSSISRFALIGLSNHIGHHQDDSKQYHEIAYSERGPRLPYGYFMMNLWVKLDNKSYQKMAIKALDDFRRSHLA